MTRFKLCSAVCAANLGRDAGGGRPRVRAVDGDDKEARRQAILDAAERLFAERNELANVADVAEAAGLAKGTVYLYFQTKEEMYLALHLRHEEMFFTALIERLQGEAPFRFEDIHALARRHMIDDPTHMALGACCIGFAPNAVPAEAAANFQSRLVGWLLTAGAGLERHLPRLAPGEGVRLLKHSYALMIGLHSLRHERSDSDLRCPVLPGLGTYQQEASLALIRYWAHVAGIPDSTVEAMSRATGLPEFNRDTTPPQP